MQIDFNGRVAIVTGAGGGLGREHALALAARGAKVVINDFDRPASGTETITTAEAVVNEILRAGGQAIVSHASVTDEAGIRETVAEAMSKWGRVDILINNAGILRDQSFTKMNLDDFRLVMEVHLMGAVICTKAVWDIMRAQNYGRIVMTTSSSGLFGNFGQSNYGAAKMALVGLMQTLSIEGAKHDIRVNCLAPTAATQMTQGLWPDQVLKAFRPEFVTPAVVVLAAQDAPNRTILCAGAGTFEAAHITMTGGAWVGNDEQTAEHLRERLTEVTDRTGSVVPKSAEAQGVNEGTKALAAIGDTNE
jgi:NAD(P)-dependent dehydrogenase (short-subunit alcohol dehydrogenase family)